MFYCIHVNIVLFQTRLQNGTYEQHSTEEKNSVVLTSYNGVFRIEVCYENLYCRYIFDSRISYEFLPDSYTCTGKLQYPYDPFKS